MAHAEALIDVEVVCAEAPHRVRRCALRLPAGSTAVDALRACGWWPDAGQALPAIGIWGKRCDADAPLREHDRVELYRPLAIDPMQARRQRGRRARDAAKPRR